MKHTQIALVLAVMATNSATASESPHARTWSNKEYCYGARVALSETITKMNGDWFDVELMYGRGQHWTVEIRKEMKRPITGISWRIEFDERWKGSHDDCLEAWRDYTKELKTFTVEYRKGLTPTPPAKPNRDISEDHARDLVNAFRGSSRQTKPRQLSESEQRSEQRARSLVDAFKEK